MISNEKSIYEKFIVPLYHKMKNEEFVIDKTGVKTVEILDGYARLDPNGKILNLFGIKKTNEKYAEEELKWYDSQDLSVKEISKHAKIWADVCTKNEKMEVNSNYGHLIYSEENGKQFENVVSELLKNPLSRRAIMIYNRPQMHVDYCRDGMSDFICTLCHQFFIRDDKLLSIPIMRSNDFIFGFVNDFYWFSTVHERVYDVLKAKYENLQLGEIIYKTNSMHVYERHFQMLEKMFLVGSENS
jgi:thymidylate synthase